MSDFITHPGLILIFGGLFLFWTKNQSRKVGTVAVAATAFAAAITMPTEVSWSVAFLDYELVPLKADKLSKVFAVIFTLMATLGGLYSLGQRSRLEVPAAFIYAGSAVGVTLAGDWFTAFAYWEFMAVASTLVLWSAGTAASARAAQRYAIMHLLGGVILFAGVTGHVLQTGHVSLGYISLNSPAEWLLLLGVLVNAGAPPFSSWLPDAYPEASWSGSVFLSAFTTKTAVYLLIRSFAGHEVLIWVGLYMAYYGIVYALLENDMRRILSYSIINQVGFMITGIGIGTEMALNGAAAHAFAHIIYKALLLMSAGSVLMMTNRRKCSELGGLFHTMPWTTLFGTIGALAISAFPLTSGFVTKSMITQASADEHLFITWLLLAGASAGVFLHAGIKFPWFVFFQKDSGLRPPEPGRTMLWAMAILSALCIGIGVWPTPLYQLLPFEVNYEAYSGGHLVTQTQLLLFSGLAFFVMLRYLRRTLTITLDTDWVWRRLMHSLLSNFLAFWNGCLTALSLSWDSLSGGVSNWIERWSGEKSRLSRTSSTRAMTYGLVALLLAQLIFFYV